MHDVKAFVAVTVAIADIVEHLPSAVLCPLVQGFSLTLLTDEVLDELGRAHAPIKPSHLQIPDIAPKIERFAQELSHTALSHISQPSFTEALAGRTPSCGMTET